MRDRIRFGTLVGCAWLGVATAAAEPQARVAKFAGDRAAAISYTFDDNLRDQYTLAVPMLNAVGFKGTFFVIPSATAETPEEGQKKEGQKRAWGGISWPELKEMAAQGHEIASHTWSHPNLQKLSAADVEAQFAKANEAIATHLGSPPLTLAFPFNADTPEIQAIASRHYVAFRDKQASTSGKSTTESLNAWADKLVKEKAWGVMMTHGVASGYAAMSSPDVFRDHLRYVKGREAEVWVDTFANVARYVKERDDAKLTLTPGPGDTAATVTIGGTLDPQRFDVPLTVVVEGTGATSAHAERDGKELPARVVNGTIQFDAPPSTQPVAVTWK